MTSASENPAAEITAAFGTFELHDETTDDDKATIDCYDPYGVGTPSPKKESPGKKLSKDKKPTEKKTPEKKVPYLADDVVANSVPPLISINFKIHEEISSIASVDSEIEGSSEIMVQGGIMALMSSSDALKNAPWILDCKTKNGSKVDITPNVSYSKKYDVRGQRNKVNLMTIPKATVGFVPVASYYFKETIDHMPVVSKHKLSNYLNAVRLHWRLTN